MENKNFLNPVVPRRAIWVFRRFICPGDQKRNCLFFSHPELQKKQFSHPRAGKMGNLNQSLGRII